MRVVLSLILSVVLFSCMNKEIINGDSQLDKYLHLLQNKKVALVVNQSSIIGNSHLIDTLLFNKIDVQKIFAPEHGIRGNADAGEKVTDETDLKTGIPIISLYGTHKKPFVKDLEGIDIVVFDLQDVGVRFYTYISTMHYVMEACAENNIPFVILDRPNPNGDYVAGPVLEPKYQSFVGMHPIPIVHGLTVGELAQMINGESWLSNGMKTDLTIIKCENYTHESVTPLAVKPSPNLPNLNAIRWYPSICLFEETQVSVGRGTLFPFEVFGSPNFPSYKYPFTFTPISIEGMSKNPPFLNKECNGLDLRETPNIGELRYDLLVSAYNDYTGKKSFFKNKKFTYLLCGTKKIVEALEAGKTAEEISHLFDDELIKYKELRSKYLLYPDFDEK